MGFRGDYIMKTSIIQQSYLTSWSHHRLQTSFHLAGSTSLPFWCFSHSLCLRLGHYCRTSMLIICCFSPSLWVYNSHLYLYSQSLVLVPLSGVQSFLPLHFPSAPPTFVSPACRVCRILQLPLENAQVILLILLSWVKKKKKKDAYIKADRPNGFFSFSFFSPLKIDSGHNSSLTEKFSWKAPSDGFTQMEKLLV